MSNLIINQEETEADMAARIASERLFLNADKTKVVLEGDPDARTLLASAGSEIPPEFDDFDIPAKFLDKGSKAEPKIDEPGLTVIVEDDEKAVVKPVNKAVKKSANK